MQRRVWLAVAAALALSAVIGWWAQTQTAAGTAPAAAGEKSDVPNATPARAAPPPPAAAPVAQAAPTASNTQGGAPTQISLDLCGVGPVTLRLPAAGSDPNRAELPRHLLDQAMAEAWPRALAALEAAPGDRSRAAALVLRAAGLPEPADTLPFVRQLAELGRSTRDAGALQWALAVCERAPTLPQCRAISPSDLVALEPDDGQHWLQLGAVNMARRDEALVQASQARFFGSEPSLAAAVDAAAPADLLPYLRQKLLIDATGVEAALVSRSGGFVLFTACAKARADNTAACSTLADAMYKHGQDLRSLDLAMGVGKRMGWSAERVGAMRAEQMRWVAQLPQVDPTRMLSCTGVDQLRRWTREKAEVGERAALERRAAAALSAPQPPSR